MIDFDLLLFDRIKIIRDVVNKYGEDNFYIAFSGGKDSTCLSRLVDLALPGNSIPRVYVDTGIEFHDIRVFVGRFCIDDNRFRAIAPKRPIRKVLDNYGYPFKSKEHSHVLATFQHSGFGRSVDFYLGKVGHKIMVCPECLKYQFDPAFSLRVSDKCCQKLKKEPIAEFVRASGRSICMTGMRRAEGGKRSNINCVVANKDGSISKFHPLAVVDDSFMEWFICKYDIRLAPLYYPPYSFRRTGCKGCPFSLDLQEQLTKMALYLPAERQQCEIIWAPVYQEYRRIGFRLDRNEQLLLF